MNQNYTPQKMDSNISRSFRVQVLDHTIILNEKHSKVLQLPDSILDLDLTGNLQTLAFMRVEDLPD